MISKMRKIFGCTGNMCYVTKDIFCHVTTGEELFFHESFVQYHLWENLIATEILVDREIFLMRIRCHGHVLIRIVVTYNKCYRETFSGTNDWISDIYTYKTQK